MKNTPETITEALDLYEVGHSLAETKNHMWKHHGIKISETSIRNWVKKYSKKITNYTETLPVKVEEMIHEDEVEFWVNGKKTYFWRAKESKTDFKFSCPVGRRSMANCQRLNRQIKKRSYQHMLDRKKKHKKKIRFVSDKLAHYKTTHNKMFRNVDGYIGDYALKKTGFPVDKDKFNNTVTLALRRELIRLGIQSKETARYASEKVKGKWWSGGLLFFVDIKKRNFDIGLDDGYITPIIVPGICEGAEPEPLAVPTKDILSEYGFSIKCKIDPVVWEKDEILAVLNPGGVKIIDVEKHYPEIMKSIEEEAVKKYGYDIGAVCSR